MVYGNPLSDMTRSRGGVNPDDAAAALEQAFVAEFGSRGKIAASDRLRSCPA